ncbi:hypothetical protein FOA43_000743 [Brettanomyces nanus]|uniref:Uncharacterized protein n=1 Tax=Eeniella nana TaxID=13502 RepID=A0A875RXZ3_EENNA|nr:uncharacterized protein FOA43_000743 [Brettanomyces nanus]QPG73433.1 hypothetical protein FOA43_000743 [Brettanomyces nanus]
MYRHPNLSTSSSGSAKRLSTNNPFRNVLLQEEATVSKDAQFKQWMDKRIKEESESDGDSNSFSEGDEALDFTGLSLENGKNRKPRLVTHKSDSTMVPPRSDSITLLPNYEKDLPPTYEEAVGDEHANDEYPRDIKESLESDGNPFPTASFPRRAKTVRVSGHSRTQWDGQPELGSGNPGHSNLDRKRMTATEETEILSDGRVRSRSAGQSSLPSHDEHRKHHPRHHHHSHRDDEGHRLHRHRSSRRKFVMEKPKNLDTIDKLDVTGFYGGAKFHHDGPFDACTPHRNKDIKQAPVLAFPPDGPNNSIKGVGPLHSKADQYDLVFGLSEEDPLYSTKISRGANTPPTQDRQASSSQQQLRAQVSPSEQRSSSQPPRLQFYTGKTPYGNGLVVKKASRSTVGLNDIASNPNETRFDVNTKSTPVHGDTTLGLGSSTFLDGAPASTVTQKKAIRKEQQKSELGRKKSLLDSGGFLKRVKSMKVKKSSRD